MLVSEAKSVARDWAIENASKLPGFHGVYLAGSITAPADNAELPLTSDVDLNVVLDRYIGNTLSGKLVHSCVLFDITYLAIDQL
jgi:hypothetical protein